MADKDIIDLMNREFDGSASRDEIARLHAYLDANPEAHREYEDLRRTLQILSSVEAVEPPAGMKVSIMNSLQRNTSPRVEKSGILGSLSRLFHPARPLRIGYAFSVGLAVGVLVYALYVNVPKGDSFDASDASGAIALKESPDKVERGESFDVTLPQVHAAIAVQYLRTLPLINVHLASEQSVTANMTFDANNIRVRAVRQFNDPGSIITIRGSEVSIAGTGSNEYTIFFANETPAGTPVHVSILASGKLLYEKTISLGRPIKQ